MASGRLEQLPDRPVLGDRVLRGQDGPEREPALEAGAQQSKAISSREDYVAERPGQWTAARADLVAELGKIPAIAKMRAGG